MSAPARENRPFALDLVEPFQLDRPLLLAEVRVSRQYRLHVLYYPQETKPRFFNHLGDALHDLAHRGHHTLTIDINGEHYHLSTLKEKP